MKTILLFGDSNTHGANPKGERRFARHERWGGVCADQLGSDYTVIEEGCGGRTTVHDDPIEGALQGSKNGLSYLLPCLHSHRPVDLLVILLGTNDLKKRFSLPPQDVAAGAGVLIGAALKTDMGVDGSAPHILLICPPPFAPLEGTPFVEMFEGGFEKSHQLAPHYERIASLYGVDYMNAGDVVTSSTIDGIHWEVEEHLKLGIAAAAKIATIL